MYEKAALKDEVESYFVMTGDDIPAPHPDLSGQTMARVHAEITARDIVELFSSVFILGCCLPLLGMLFGGAFVIEEDHDE